MFMISFVALLVGLYALLKGAELFVEGSSSLARNYHISGMIIGLTIVAFGTSAPELAVSTSAAWLGSNEIALSNVVGSNIFNLLFVLGVCAVIQKVPLDVDFLKRDYPVTIFSTLALLLLTSSTVLISGKLLTMKMDAEVGTLTRPIAVALLLAFAVYMFVLIRNARSSPKESEEPAKFPVSACIVYIAIGLMFVIGGAQAVVFGAKEIAKIMGMTETLIGLTVVAIGTSLPELVTSIVAAKKGEAGLAVGNAVGSNIFNLLFILGVSGLIHPISVNAASVYDMIVLTVISVMAFVFSKTSKCIDVYEGLAMVAVYAGYMVFAVIR